MKRWPFFLPRWLASRKRDFSDRNERFVLRWKSYQSLPPMYELWPDEMWSGEWSGTGGNNPIGRNRSPALFDDLVPCIWHIENVSKGRPKMPKICKRSKP